MARIGHADESDCLCPHLVDDGAPFSGIGETEFYCIQKKLIPEWNGVFNLVP